MINILVKVKNVMNKILSAASVVLLVFMTSLVLWQVFTRYVLGKPAAFTEELVKYSLMWTAFIGAAYAFFTRDHMSLTIIKDKLTGNKRKILLLVIDVLILLLAVFVFVIGGFKLAMSARAEYSALLGIPRTLVYYGGIPVSEEELECKSIIDHLHTDNPTWGARQMSAQLKLRGYQVGRRKAGRYMREMDITPIYPKMNLSKRMKQAKVCPYLLRNAVIDRSNQAWSIDITYIPMKHGFLYLTAIIDWYSRCIVGWDVDDTLDTTMVINACKKAFKVAKPLIINSDQGSQFTSDKYIEFIRDNGIRQSMDGKSRWADNIMIERWFRSFKYEEAYLTEYANLKEAREAIGRYIYTYNFERCHQSIGNKRPAEVYYPVMLLDAARAAA